MRELQARNAYTYHIDEFPPESAVGRCFGSSSSLSGSVRAWRNERERERERDGVAAIRTERDEGQADKDGDKGAWERDRSREREKKCKGEKTGRERGERQKEATVQKGRGRCMENMDGVRRREVAEGNEREPLLQREIRERGGEGTVKTEESNKYLGGKGW